MSRLIERDDFQEIRQLAKKYNMSVAEFGRTIARQTERNRGWTIHLTDEEYNYIKHTAEKNNMTVARFGDLACRAFLKSDKKPVLDACAKYGENRTKKLAVRIYNSSDETEIAKLAIEYKVKIGALIRYCVLRFDGKNINLEGE